MVTDPNTSNSNDRLTVNKSSDTLLHPMEVNEILSSPRQGIFKWGIGIILAIIAICLFMTGFIRYPNIISSKMIAGKPESLITGHFAIKLLAPKEYLNKVKIGQKIVLKLDSYMNAEAVIMSGYIKEIPVGKKNEFIVGLESNDFSHFSNFLKNETITGVVYITTDNLSIIERIISKLNYSITASNNGA